MARDQVPRLKSAEEPLDVLLAGPPATGDTKPTRARNIADDDSCFVEPRSLLGRVTAPTLVLHCRDDAAVPFDEGRRLAAGIKGARFVALEGRNHLILESDPGWNRLVEEIKNFLGR